LSWIFFLGFSVAGTSYAQPGDTLELAGFFDGMMHSYLSEKNVPGGTVSLVRDGKILFSKGYGFADVNEQTSVDPEKTLFRIGSISKLFTWITVMQLVEKGMLDLDTDINQYLKKVKVPDTFDRPITMRHLMTHTPGFEDRVIHLFVKETGMLRPLTDILSEELPKRIWPPGEVTSYSNHGTGLAALVVEDITGRRWIDYFEENIRKPLQLNHFSFEQPLPLSLQKDMSKGYHASNGEFFEQDFELVPMAPVGAASASAHSMAAFMITCLNYGLLDSTRILDSLSVARMYQVNHQNVAGINGACLGFFEMNDHDQRIIGHGGDTFWFHSVMALYPEHDLGIFISLNSDSGSPDDLLAMFNDHYFPIREHYAKQSVSDLSKFEGTYRSVRFPHSTIAKISALMSSYNVEEANDGLLKTSGQKTRYWVPSGPLEFLEKNGTDKMVFKENEEGKIAFMFMNSLPYFAFEKAPFLASPSLHTFILAFYLVMVLLTIIHWPLSYINRKEYIPKNRSLNLLPMRPKLAVWMASFLTMAFFVGLAWVFKNPVEIVYGIPGLLKGILIIPIAVAALLIYVLFYLPGIISGKTYKRSGKIHLLMVTISLMLFIWQCHYWNMLGYHF
jgi:CubicO group peptidase (beta-lactamase class C family)